MRYIPRTAASAPVLGFDRSRFAFSIFLVSAVGWLAGCHSWVRLDPVAEAVDAQSRIEPDERDDLRFHLDNGRVIEGKVVGLNGDTVEVGREGVRSVPVPLERVRGAEIRQLDSGKTIGLVIGTAVTVGAIVGLVVAYSNEPGFSVGYPLASPD